MKQKEYYIEKAIDTLLRQTGFDLPKMHYTLFSTPPYAFNPLFKIINTTRTNSLYFPKR